jgi:hypothetical protein
MGGGSAPAPTTPQESAQAAALTNLAGNEFDVGSAPIKAYSEALNQLQYNPVFNKIQNATAANTSLSQAKTKANVASQTNPYSSAAINSLGRATADKVGRIAGGYTPGLTQTNTAGIYDYPTQNSLPDLGTVQQQAAGISASLPQVNVGQNSVGLTYPTSAQYTNANIPTVYNGPSGGNQMPSIPGYQFNPATQQYTPNGPSSGTTVKKV